MGDGMVVDGCYYRLGTAVHCVGLLMMGDG